MRNIIYSWLIVCLANGFTTNGQGIPDIEWDAAFTRTEGWSGGDAAGTVDLGDGRTLWMFADSWIGGVVEGKHAPGSFMVNNVIAIHDSSDLGVCRAPDYTDIKFYWGNKNKKRKPEAWIIPENQKGKEWYWFNGCGVVLPGNNGTDRLVMFLFKLTSRGEEGGVWNFKGTGSAMAIVDNMDDPVDKWIVKQVQIPLSGQPNPETNKQEDRIIKWGVSTYLPKTSESQETGRWLYIYGIDETNPKDKHLLLARVLQENIDNVYNWEYYKGNGSWTEKMHNASSIASGLVSEISVDAIGDSGKEKLILVQSETMFGKRIFARTASNPEGPWSVPVNVYNVPALDRGKEYFTYAAKGHLHLSCSNELLITYIINSMSFWEMADDASIYRPRFVRVPLNLILSTYNQ